MKPMLPLRSWRWIPTNLMTKVLMGWATTLSKQLPGRVVPTWSALRGTPVRLRWVLKDVDVYAFQFPE